MGEDGGVQLVAHRFKQVQLIGVGQVLGFKIAAHKIAANTCVGLVEELAVHPFVVHGQAYGLTHPRIFELWQTGVEHKALEVPRIAVLQLFFDQGAVVKQLSLVASCPFTGDKGLDVIKFTGFETLELGGGVFVDAVADAVEIKQAFAHIQVFRPIVVVAHILNVFAEIDLA